VDTFFARRWLGPKETLAVGSVSLLPESGWASSVFWRDLLRHIPGVRSLNRGLQSYHFQKGCRRLRPLLYHEPNFIAFPFDGPTVVTVHDLSFFRHPETHPADRVRFMSNHIEASLQQAQVIVAVSDFVRQEIEQLFGDWVARKTTVVPNGVTADFQPMPKAQTAKVLGPYGLSHGQYLLTLGTLEPRKNLPALLRAYCELPSSLKVRIPLVVVGPKGWRASELKSLAQRMRNENIRWLGYCQDHERPALYAGASAFAYPSVYEGFGLPALEAMASGLPTLVGASLAVQEVCGPAALVVEPGDTKQFAQALQRLLEDPALREHLAEAALQRAQTFSWTTSAERLLQVYQPLVKAAG
jgi:glycosyltransferase involved in cell wall biosynthesis